MHLGCGIGAWQLSLVRKKLSSILYIYIGRGVLFSSKVEGIISGENRLTKRLEG
jgi:hypothetical protein